MKTAANSLLVLVLLVGSTALAQQPCNSGLSPNGYFARGVWLLLPALPTPQAP